MTDPTIAPIEEPAHAPRWGVGATVLWALLISAIYSVVQFVVVMAYIAVTSMTLGVDSADAVIENLESNGTLLGVATVATAIVCIPLIFGIIKLKRGANIRSYLGLKGVSRRAAIVSIALGCALVVVTDLLYLALGRPVVPEFMTDAYVSAHPVWILWLAVVVAAPLLEESFFRGFLFHGLERSRLGVRGTIVITSLAWALIHIQYDYLEVATIFVLGIFLGVVRSRTGSLLLPVVLHAMTNLVGTVETAMAVG